VKRWFLGLKRVQYVVAFVFLVAEMGESDYKRFSDVPSEERVLMMQKASLNSSLWLALHRGDEIPPAAVRWYNGEITHAEMVAEVERVTGKPFS